MREFHHPAFPQSDAFTLELPISGRPTRCRAILHKFWGADLLTERIGYQRLPAVPGARGPGGDPIDAERARFPEAASLPLLLQMAQALRFMHGTGWIHGRVCLANFVTKHPPLADPARNCKLKLIGFSDAQRIGAEAPLFSVPLDFPYGAPELREFLDCIKSRNPDYTGVKTVKTDIYALGICFALLLLGNLSHLQTMEHFGWLSPGMTALIRRMVDPDAQRRPDIAEVLADPFWAGVVVPDESDDSDDDDGPASPDCDPSA
jgi:serine/threonine protein kinase